MISLNLIKYSEYADYLSSYFFNTLLTEFTSYYNLESGVSKDVLLKIFIKMKVQQKLSEEIRKGDIDLEIKLIDKYQTLTDNIIAKLKIAPNTIDSETILIKALEEYNTDRIFSLYILDKIKEELSKDKIEKDFDFSKIIKEVKSTKITAALDPMNSYERRFVHNLVSEYKNLTTESIGEGRDRRVTIKYKEN